MPKISEEQRQAQLGYLDRTLRPMAVGNPQQQYDATLNAIRKGFTIFEHRARELAEKHGIDITGLPKAINDGERRLLGMYVDAITEKEGHSAFEPDARELANRLGYDLDQLVEDAIINNSGPV